MLDAGMDAHDWPGSEEDMDAKAREALAALFVAMLNAGWDHDTAELILFAPAAFLGVEFIPVEDLH